jgi:flavin-dependent dehydrogenase
MNNTAEYDVALIGGGLAGLAASILLAEQGCRVVLLEKETYPFHKVCGEYISLESLDLLIHLGADLNAWQVPVVKRLMVSSPSGTHLVHPLPLGGIGISRACIDHNLSLIARRRGVDVLENTKVEDVTIGEGDSSKVDTIAGSFTARVVGAAFGKRSNLDVRWNRKFTQRKPNPLNNFLGVKYHASLDHPRDLIALHNFNDGYCGISPVEDGKTCICYLTTARNLKQNGNSIAQMERTILFRNPFLKQAFEKAVMLYDRPLTISQVSFEGKKQFENGIFFLGDAASMIAPLCGNGMSMALKSSVIFADIAMDILRNKTSVSNAGERYTALWRDMFNRRLTAGRFIQRFFGSEWLSNAAISFAGKFPHVLTALIRQTHGH